MLLVVPVTYVCFYSFICRSWLTKFQINQIVIVLEVHEPTISRSGSRFSVIRQARRSTMVFHPPMSSTASPGAIVGGGCWAFSDRVLFEAVADCSGGSVVVVGG